MGTMTTLSEVTNLLKERGYTMDFNLKEDCLECGGNFLKLFPGDFVIDKIYRFEGTSDPADEAIVYAISSEKFKMKGVLVNGYGVSSDKITSEMIAALDEKNELNP
jgi:hypothetical protein